MIFLKKIFLTLRLLMLRILANNHDFSVSLDDLAFFADRFYGRSYLHLSASFAFGAGIKRFRAPAALSPALFRFIYHAM